jgi:hypothetical protein
VVAYDIPQMPTTKPLYGFWIKQMAIQKQMYINVLASPDYDRNLPVT